MTNDFGRGWNVDMNPLINRDYTGKVTHSCMFIRDDVECVYVKDESYAYKARVVQDADNPYNVYVLEPEAGINIDNLVDYLSDFVKVRLISETDKPSRAGNHGGHSTTGGRKRSWFDLSALLNGTRLNENHIAYTTLYAMNMDDVYGEKVNDIDVPTLVFRTFNNRLIRRNNDAEELERDLVIGQWLYRAGYKVIAVPKNVKISNENIVEVNELDDAAKDAIKDALVMWRHRNAVHSAASFLSDLNVSAIAILNKFGDGSLTEDDLGIESAEDTALDYLQTLKRGDFTVSQKMLSVALEMLELSEEDFGAFETFDDLFKVVNKVIDTGIIPLNRS